MLSYRFVFVLRTQASTGVQTQVITAKNWLSATSSLESSNTLTNGGISISRRDLNKRISSYQTGSGKLIFSVIFRAQLFVQAAKRPRLSAKVKVKTRLLPIHMTSAPLGRRHGDVFSICKLKTKI